jgi:hypothetical protein
MWDRYTESNTGYPTDVVGMVKLPYALRSGDERRTEEECGGLIARALLGASRWQVGSLCLTQSSQLIATTALNIRFLPSITYSTTEPAKTCQAYKHLLSPLLPTPMDALSLQHEGRVLLALKAYKAGEFRSHCAAATAFNVKRYILDERAKGVPPRAETPSPRLKLTSTEEETIV